MTTHRIFAAIYDRMMAPVECSFFGPRREALLTGRTGRVLDVGAGTGVNLRYFKQAGRVIEAEPDPAMRSKLARKLDQASVPAEICDAAAEACRSQSWPAESIRVHAPSTERRRVHAGIRG